MYGRLALHAESVVLPLLASDAPVVTWWYGEPPRAIAHDPLGVLADRRVTDAALSPDPIRALHQRAQDYAPGDTDLAWTRATQWRALCASAFDSVTGTARRAQVHGAADDPTRALLVGWLTARLGVPVEAVDTNNKQISAIRIELDDGEVELSAGRQNAVLRRTGQPERTMSLESLDLGDLLAEELRRLDADETYAEALAAATGESALSDRSAVRTHVWHDPTEESDPDPALTVA
jgi:glucose-6-phosphate dehydrogenase assembly protein OpcA